MLDHESPGPVLKGRLSQARRKDNRPWDSKNILENFSGRVRQAREAPQAAFLFRA